MKKLLILLLLCRTAFAGVNLEVPIELMDVGAGSTTAGPILYYRSYTYFDISDYDGNPECYFEIVAYNSSGSYNYDVDLYDVTNSQVLATITVPLGTSVLTLKRSALFVPNVGNNVIGVRVADLVGGANVLRAHTARVVVVQTNATKTRIQIPMISNGSYSGANSGSAGFVSSHNSVSYTDTPVIDPEKYYRFLKTSTNFATISGWSFETVLSISNSATTAYATLWNVTDNNQVSDTEVSTAISALPTLLSVDFADNATNFHNGDEFEVYIRTGQNPYSANIHKAALYVELTNLSKAEIYWRVNECFTGATAAKSTQQARALMTTSNYTSPTIYYEITGYCADNDGIFNLQDASTNDSGTAGAAVADAEINCNSATKARHRSVALSLDDGDRYYGYKDVSTNAGSIAAGMILITCESAAAPPAEAQGQVIFVNQDW